MKPPTRVNHPPDVNVPADNRPLVAPIYQSVKFTFDRATNPETKATISSELSTIAATEIVDPYTVNVATKTPDFLLPVRLGELFGLMTMIFTVRLLPRCLQPIFARRG